MLDDPSPLYFLGHSKGACLAVELCIALEQCYHFIPRRIFNASMGIPQVWFALCLPYRTSDMFVTARYASFDGSNCAEQTCIGARHLPNLPFFICVYSISCFSGLTTCPYPVLLQVLPRYKNFLTEWWDWYTGFLYRVTGGTRCTSKGTARVWLADL